MLIELTEKDRARFWSRVVKSDGCWLWRGAPNIHGYGRLCVRTNGKPRHITASRVAYHIAYGTFKESLHVLHKCDNPLCVRPDHLFLGTHHENVLDMVAKERHGRMKISAHDAKDIRHLYWAERRSQSEIGKHFGLSQPQVSQIVRRTNWRPTNGPD